MLAFFFETLTTLTFCPKRWRQRKTLTFGTSDQMTRGAEITKAQTLTKKIYWLKTRFGTSILVQNWMPKIPKKMNLEALLCRSLRGWKLSKPSLLGIKIVLLPHGQTWEFWLGSYAACFDYWSCMALQHQYFRGAKIPKTQTLTKILLAQNAFWNIDFGRKLDAENFEKIEVGGLFV